VNGAGVPPDAGGELSKRLLDILEWASKALIGLAAVWAAVEKIGKPYNSWRRHRTMELVRETLQPQLDQLDRIAEREQGMLNEFGRLAQRQAEVFRDLDDLMIVTTDTRERLDEVNAVLDIADLRAVEEGIASRDRRTGDEDRRAHADDRWGQLQERRRARRRLLPPTPPEVSP